MTEPEKTGNDLPPLETSIPTEAVPLERLLCTEELRRRPWRAPDYQKENRALVALANALADSPRTVLQILAERILEVTESDSSGVSLLNADGKRFYWPAVAGIWKPHTGGGTPRNFGPCGDVLDRNMPLLMRHWEWRYTYFLTISPPVEEGLLVPFYVGGRAVGTIWAVMHDDHRKFDAEDERLLTSLSKFASTAYQALSSIDDLKFQIGEREKAEAAMRELANGLEAKVRVRTQELERSAQELLTTNKELEREIAERKRAEEDLRLSEAKFRALSETAPVAIYIMQGTRFLYANPALTAITGYSQEELLAMNFWEIVHPDFRELVKERGLARHRGEAVPARYEFKIMTKQGEERWVDFSDGKFQLDGKLAIAAMAFDITERKRTEETLRQTQERWRAAFENSNVGIALSDLASTRFLAANVALQEMLGYCEDELRALTFMELTHEDDREPNRRLLTELVEGKQLSFQMQKRYRRKDGNFIWADIHVSLISGATSHSRISVAIIEDITERKRAEEALSESEERFRATFENAGTGMALVDMQGRPIRCNPALEKILGYSQKELSAMVFTEFTHPDDRDPDMGLYLELTAGKRDKYDMEKRYITKGGSLVWGHLIVSLVRGKDGSPAYAVGMVEDITGRKRAIEELQRSRDQLRALAARLQNVREEERTRLAREIHDELGSDLTAIKFDLSSLLRDLPAKKRPEHESILKEVDATLQTVRRISTDLRPPLLDTLGPVAAVEWAAEEFGERTGIQCRLDLPPGEVAIDQERATALFRIFQETLTNVMRHANATEVEVRLAKENGNLLLEIHDNGKGIDEEQISRGGSLGILGMRERASLLGGKLTVDGAPGRGTTVRLRIPQRQAP